MRSDADVKGQRARWLLGAGVVVALIATWSSWDQVQIIQTIVRGGTVDEAAVSASDSRQQLIGVVQLGAGIVVAIGFLMWTSAVTKRLLELGVTDLRYAPKWSVWGFIVPILNFFRPYQVMSELWKASEIDAGPSDPLRPKGTQLIVRLWFAALLIDSFVGRVLLQSSQKLDTLEQLTQYATLTLVSDALGILSAGLAFQMVTEIDGRLRASEARHLEAPPAVVAPPA